MEQIEKNIKEYISNIDKIQELVDKLSKIEWDDQTAKSFCEEQGLEVSEVMILQIERYPSLLPSLNSFDYDNLKRKITICKEQSEIWLKINFNECNEPYKKYVNSSISNINNNLNNFFTSLQDNYPLGQYLNTLILNLRKLPDTFNININELFENFKYGNKNYVIFGKNGAGKTSLLKNISSSIFSNSIVIPANRQLNPSRDGSFSINPGYNLNQILSQNNCFTHLMWTINHQTLESYDKGIQKENVLRTKLYNIFSDLGIEREIIADKELLFLQTEGIQKYSLVNASDGEKSVAYLIMAVLLSPQDAFIFIDEPERHLNGALMRKLFDKLEEERPDLRFIYLTHITDFVESRKNVELIYLEKTKTYNKWKFKKIDNYENISLDVLLSIEGTKEDIIFCEGKRSSIDCKILECLFPQHEIKPVESCEQVKMNTKGINGKENLFRRKAYGLIDNDYMEEDEIDKLKKDNIIAIGYNEWENFLICSEILEYINSTHLGKDISQIKEKIINQIKTNSKDTILNDFTTKRYAQMVHLVKFKYDATLETQIDKNNDTNKKRLIDSINDLKSKIENSDNYDELVSIVPAKMLLNTVAKGMGFNTDNDYVDFVVNQLQKDKALNELVKNKLNICF